MSVKPARTPRKSASVGPGSPVPTASARNGTFMGHSPVQNDSQTPQTTHPHDPLDRLVGGDAPNCRRTAATIPTDGL